MLNIFLSKYFGFVTLLFVMIFFTLVLTFFRFNTVHAEGSVNVSANVYACDLRIRLGVIGNKSETDYTTNAELSFESITSKSFVLKIPINRDGKASVNLCNNKVYLQGGKYDVSLTVFTSGYKKISNIDLFKTYQTNLDIELLPSELTALSRCNISHIKQIESSNNSSKDLENDISTSIFSKDKIPLAGLVIIYPFLKKKQKSKVKNKTKIDNIFTRFIKIYLESLKFTYVMLRSILFYNG